MEINEAEQTTNLKLFVWEGVLTDYTHGMVCVLAEDLEQAIKLIKEKDDVAAGCMDMSNVKVIEKPEAFVVWGGG